MVECCRVPEFYYGSCEVRGGTWGELLECPEIHSESGHLVEGFCESGTNYACNGHASEVKMIRTFLAFLPDKRNVHLLLSLLPLGLFCVQGLGMLAIC